jgi:two-component system nitrogen regulation response regulator GlnG
LFLDQVGNMARAVQAKVLSVLQEQTFERVGGNEAIRAGVRLIAAAHHDLKRDSAGGTFWPDLDYRPGAFSIGLPPPRGRAATCRCCPSTS